jgi:hypothetical protein
MSAQAHFTPIATKASVGFARLSSSSNSRVVFTGCKYAPVAERMTIDLTGASSAPAAGRRTISGTIHTRTSAGKQPAPRVEVGL